MLQSFMIWLPLTLVHYLPVHLALLIRPWRTLSIPSYYSPRLRTGYRITLWVGLRDNLRNLSVDLRQGSSDENGTHSDGSHTVRIFCQAQAAGALAVAIRIRSQKIRF